MLFRHKAAALAALLLPPVLLVGLAFATPETYEAETRVLVRPAREFMPRPEGSGSSPSAPQTTMREMVDTVMQTVTSLDLLWEVAQEVGVGRLYPDIAAAAPDPEALKDRAMRALREDLSAWPIRLTNVIEIKLRNRDRDVAEEALKVAVARFEERHVRAYNNTRTEFLEREVGANLAKLDQVQEERTRYITERGLFDVDEQRSLVVQQRNRLQQDLRDAEMRAAALQSQIAFLRTEIAHQPPMITLSATVQASEAAATANRRMHETRERMQEASETYGSNHPVARAARAALQAAEQAVRQTDAQTRAVSTGVNPLHTTLLQQLATAETERTPLAGRIETLKSLVAHDEERLRSIAADEVRLRNLNTRIAEIEAANTTLSQRLTDARVTDDLDRAKVAGLSVIQAPKAFSQPIWPLKWLYALGGLALGLVASGFVLLVTLTFGNRFVTAETIERILGAPVLVALPPFGEDGPAAGRTTGARQLARRA